jgi:hypothetical protein
LAGYEDSTPVAAAKMRAAELAVLRRLEISPSERDARWRTDADSEDRST